MTLLILFVSLYIGINIRVTIVSSVIELLLIVLLIILKLKKRLLIISGLVVLIGLGISYIRPSNFKPIYSGMVVEVKENYYVFSSSLEKFYISEKNHGYEIGDYLTIEGNKKELDFTRLESEFDFKDYLNRKGVYYELSVKQIEVKFLTPFRINSVKKNILSKFDSNSNGVIGSIFFNYSSNGELVELSRDMHLLRLVSASGVFLYLFLNLINKFLSLFVKKEKIRKAASIILLSPYLIFTFPRFVVLKFFLINAVSFLLRDIFNRKISRLNIVSGCGIFFLLFDYHLAYQDSFLLAFYIPILAIFINGSFKFRKDYQKKLFLILMIRIAFIPFTAKYYSELSLLTIPLEIIFTPIYVVMAFLGALTMMGMNGSVIAGFSRRIYRTLSTFEKWPLRIYVTPFLDFVVVIYEIIFLLLIYYASIRLRPLKNFFLTILATIICCFCIPIKGLIKDNVYFINVGQGDSTLIRYKNSTILIDTGGNKYKDIATEVLIPFFKKKLIYKIDLLITTHDDFDHSGAVSSLVENFKVKQYVTDYKSFPISFNGLTLQNYNMYPDLWKEENDSSLVIGFQIHNYNYVVMGDSPKKIEKAIMEDHSYIPCDVLKVGHHGSNTSTSDEFVKFLSPKYGIISCGKNNIYGHPHKEVITILNKYHVIVRRTDLESTITF